MMLQPGNMLGQYRIVEVIGQGGMGTVYHAEHASLARHVALKVLEQGEYENTSELISRFLTEARAVNQIEHENILEVTDFVTDRASGLYYIVMEHLRGTDLEALLERVGPLQPLRCVAIGKQVAGALRAAHEAGIIHRDLKSENVFLTQRSGREDFVKILDFGVAKLLEEAIAPMGLTSHATTPGTMLGTPTHMSPEQAAGLTVDSRSDIYSLGVILYQMATGRVPFEGDSLSELLEKQTSTAPRRPGEYANLPAPVPPALESLILACLAKEPAARPQTMREVAEDLESIERAFTEPLHASNPPPAAPGALPPQEKQRAFTPTPLTIALIIGTALISFGAGAALGFVIGS